MNGGLSDEEYQRILAANPDWQTEEDETGPIFQRPGFIEEDLLTPGRKAPAPAMMMPGGAGFGASGGLGEQPAEARRQPAEGLRFFDKPESEQYLTGGQKKAMKDKLYAYLADKMQRRGEVTSKAYYDKADKAFAHQERVSDANALGGLLLNAGDRAGTVLGRGPASNFGQFSDALDGSRQQRIGNTRALRGMEEQSNMNDLNVARYLTEMERGDQARQDRRKSLYEQMLLRKQQAEMARERMGFQNDMARERFGLEKERLEETRRGNMAREEIMRNRPAGAGSSFQSTDVLGPEGLPLNFNRKDGSYSKPIYPPGAKLKPKESADKPLTEGERAAAGYYNNAKNAIAVLEKLEDEGYRVGTTSAIKGMLAPKALEGHVFSKQDLMYRQAVRDFVAAKLRLESGASISPAEALEQGSIYMSQAGEPDDVLTNKRKSRREALKGLSFKAGRGAEQISQMGDQRDTIKMPGDAANTQAPKNDKSPEDMTDEERKAELERLRKSVGQ
jgi:hypothetical protein